MAEAGRWTPIFFLDDAVALAAGHRPCGLCRREAYLEYRGAVGPGLLARDLDRRLVAERLRRGRGLVRAGDRLLWRASWADLPVGTVVSVDGGGPPRLVLSDRLLSFDFAGWRDPVDRPRRGDVDVLTPPTSVAALAGGFVPDLGSLSDAPP